MRRRVESARWIAGRSLALATIAGVAVCSAGCSPQSAAPASPNTAVPQSATVVVPATFIYEDGAGKQPADTTANQAPAPAGREQPVPTPATPANTVTASRAVRPPSLPPEPPPAASPTPAIIRNADVIRLARNGTTESEIVRLLTSSRSELDTSIPALVQLKKDGVSDAVIEAVLAAMKKP